MLEVTKKLKKDKPMKKKNIKPENPIWLPRDTDISQMSREQLIDTIY